MSLSHSFNSKFNTNALNAWYDDYKHKPYAKWVNGVVILLLLFILYHIFFSSHKSKEKPAQAVTVSKVITATVPVYISALGTVTPYYTDTIKTQVNGTMQQVFFQEGQIVKANDLLAQIDPRPFEAVVLQDEGALARDQALLANAKVDLVRYQTLYKQDSVAEQTLATQASLVTQDEGIVKLDQGQLQAAQVNLNYCKITSPIAGRIGLRLVDPGNYVQTSDTTGLAIVNMVSPITVIFSIPEDDVPQIIKQVYAGKQLEVQAYDRAQNEIISTGKLLSLDNQIDTTTGTVKLRAEFANNDYQLFPNQFVNIKMLVNTLQNAMLVPTAAIQEGSAGTFVYVLNNNQTVSVRPVTVSVTDNDNTVVTSGVTPGEQVVIEGADKLTDGLTVKVYNPNQAATGSGGGKRHHRQNAS